MEFINLGPSGDAESAAAAADELAKRVAMQVAGKIWELREQLIRPTPQPAEVVREAAERAAEPDRGGPVVIHETRLCRCEACLPGQESVFRDRSLSNGKGACLTG